MAKNDKNDKLDALESAISHIEKQYGKGADHEVRRFPEGYECGDDTDRIF